MKILNRACVVVFLLMLALPLLQSAFRILPRASLAGVELKSARPPLTAGKWFSGEFQKKYEKWLNERIGLRSYFVRTYNQVYFWLFAKLPSAGGTQIVIGKNGWLYERSYVNIYNHNGRTPKEKLRKIVSELKELQELLKARGKVLLLLLSPSKVELYPEYVPAGIIEPDRRSLKTEYDRILPLLDEYGINYIDAHAIFVEKKASQPYALFSPGGTHWNYYGAGIILGRVLENIEKGLGRKMPGIQCKSVRIDNDPSGSDNDLGDLLNIWFPDSIAGPQVHPVFETTPGDCQPSLLFVGDSFSFTLTTIIHAEKLSRRCDVFYYFKRRVGYLGKGVSETISASPVDWEREVLNRDAVIIEINEFFLPEIGFGFVQAAIDGLKALEHPDAACRPEEPK